MDHGEHPAGEASGEGRSAHRRLRGRGTPFPRGHENPLPPALVVEPVQSPGVPPVVAVEVELERLRWSLEVSQAAFEAAEREVYAIYDMLAVDDGRVAELDAEVLGIQDVVDAAAGFVHARGRSHAERLLDIPDRVRDAVVFGVHRGAAAPLMVA